MKIHLDDLAFDVVVEGPADAPAVLLLHGFPQTSHSWRRPAVPEGLPGDVPDQRGYLPRRPSFGLEATACRRWSTTH